MPASGDVLLDTSVVVPYFRKDAAIRQQIQTCTTLYLPLTALGELYCGAYLSVNEAKTGELEAPHPRRLPVRTPRGRTLACLASNPETA